MASGLTCARIQVLRIAVVETLKLLTWNIYFGGHMFEERCAGLVAVALRPEEPGYTVDAVINSMRYQIKQKRTQKRIDRVLLRGVSADAIDLVGTSPIDIDGTFVSDHFGILVTW